MFENIKVEFWYSRGGKKIRPLLQVVIQMKILKQF